VVKLQSFRSVFPRAEEAAGRVELLLDEPKGSEYSLEHLYKEIRPESISALAEMLDWLTAHKYLKLIYRIVSPNSRAGLAEFPSLSDVPDHVFDDVDTGRDIEVTTRAIDVIYRLD